MQRWELRQQHYGPGKENMYPKSHAKWQDESQEKTVTRMKREMASGLDNREVFGNLGEASYFEVDGRTQDINDR